tara:strand:- start:383 stop:1315 length:933 start_codon:yes stop_codon:yes gene_type:complete
VQVRAARFPNPAGTLFADCPAEFLLTHMALQNSRFLFFVPRDVALESETVAAQLAATTGIDSFVSKTKSMVALKKEQWDKKASHTRVTEERKLLPNLVRLADYMLTASLTHMANANARRLLDAVEKPDPKSKGAFATVVGFGTETTQFEPDEQTLLTAINGQVLDALALALGSVPRVANARAFAPLFEGNAGDTTNEKRNLSVKRNLSLATPLGTPRASAQSIANTDSVESLEGGGGDPARGAGTKRAFEGLGPMAVLLADEGWLAMRSSLATKITASFGDSAAFVKTYDELRAIYEFGLGTCGPGFPKS